MAASPPLLGLQDRACPSCSLAVSSRPISLPPSTRVSCHKELLGTSLLLQNALVFHDYSRSASQHSRLSVQAAKRVDRGRSLILSSTLKAQEGETKKVAELCDGIRQWASDKQKDKQVGMKRFECYVDTFDNNVFHFLEEYDSFLHMNDLRASPEHTKFMSDVRPFLLEPVALAAYEHKDGRIGDMLNPIGPKGEGGLDDATGQAGKGGEDYIRKKTSKRREFRNKPEDASKQKVNEELKDDKWSLEKIFARVTGAGTDNANRWSLKSLFGGKK